VNPIKYLLAVGLAEATAVVRHRSVSLCGTRTLMYHDLGDGSPSRDIYALSPSLFRAQMETVTEWVASQQLHFVSLGSDPQPGIAITFDDGYQSTLSVAAPLLVRLGIPFHVFATRSYCLSGNTRYLTESDLRELASLPNVVIGAHGATHAPLAQMSADDLQRELSESRDWLQQILQRPVESMSYPHGSFTPAIADAAQKHGYRYACSSKVGTYHSASQRLSIPRIDIWSRDSARTTLRKLRGSWDWIL